MKKKKKGFTLVELLVVIAILAILAAVSVVGYLSFTNKAKQSADEQAVTQMNIALEAQEAIDAPENVEEAKDVLEEAGFNVSDYVPLNKDNIFYYDQSEIRVLIYDQVKEKVTFPENLAKEYASYTDGNKPGSWFLLNDKTYEWVTIENYPGSSDSSKLQNALISASENEIVKLDRDIIFNSYMDYNFFSSCFPTNQDTGNARLDLSGHTLTINTNSYGLGMPIGASKYYAGKEVYFSQNVYIANGTINFGVANSYFSINYGSTLTLDNVKLNNNSQISNSAQYNLISVGDNSNLTVRNSTFNAINGDTGSIFVGGINSQTNIINSTLISNTYGITSNASGTESWNINVTVKDSTIIANQGSSVLVNVPGSYNFEDANLVGNGEGVVIRGGSANFINSLIKIEGNTELDINGDAWEFSTISGTADVKGDFTFPFVNKNGTWTSGNGVQFGALIVGDWATGYPYGASVTLYNTSVYMNDSWSDLPVVYLSQDNGNTTTLTYDASCKFYKNNIIEDNAIIINSMNESGVLPSGNIVVNK